LKKWDNLDKNKVEVFDSFCPSNFAKQEFVELLLVRTSAVLFCEPMSVEQGFCE